MGTRRLAIGLLILVVTALLALASYFGWLPRDRLAAGEAEYPQSESAAAHPDLDQDTVGSSRFEAGLAAAGELGEGGALVPLSMTDRELITIGGGIDGIAYSREEADWLDRNGFPKLNQLAELETTSIEELQARAASGNAVDLALLTQKRVASGRCATKAQAMDCAESFRQAAVRGSLWALARYVSTAKYFSADVDDETRRWIEAHELVAERLGIYDEATERQNQQLRELRGDDARASELANEVLASINAERAALGLGLWTRDPRPGEARQRALNDYFARSMDPSGQPRTNVRRYHYPRE